MQGSSSVAEVEVTELRASFSDTVNRVAYGKERLVVTRHGKEMVALVPIEDMRLLEALEDRIDLEEARAALVEAKTQEIVPWEKVKEGLGL